MSAPRCARLLAAACCVVACLRRGQCQAEDVGSDAAAVVNGQVITLGRVRDRLANVFFDAYAKQALDDLIKVELVKQEARRRGKRVSEAQIAQKIETLTAEQIADLRRKRKLATLEDLDRDLRKRGTSVQQLKARMRRNLRTARYSDIEATLLAHEMISESVQISETELREVYDELYGEKIEARQIVVDSRRQAEDVERRLRMGADFATLAKRESIDRRSAATGGKMRPFRPGVTPLGKAAAKLKSGEVSGVVKTKDGYHILQVVKRVQADSVSFEKVKPHLKSRILDKRMGDWMIGLMESAKIKRVLK